jgi:hypothetical protein
MSTPFKDAVRSVVDDMIRSGGSGTHVHFDDTVFDGLVPSFDDTVWLSLGREAAIEALESGTKVVVAVPIAETASRPASLSLAGTSRLHPWEPPAIYLLPVGSSAWSQRQAVWHSDEPTTMDGIHGWIAATPIGDDGSTETWRVTLYFETD